MGFGCRSLLQFCRFALVLSRRFVWHLFWVWVKVASSIPLGFCHPRLYLWAFPFKKFWCICLPSVVSSTHNHAAAPICSRELPMQTPSLAEWSWSWIGRRCQGLDGGCSDCSVQDIREQLGQSEPF